MTWTEDTTSIGRLIAGLPVAGSVTLALLTRAPLCVLRAPFMLIRPSGPRTTPGTIGNRLSKRSFTLGASAIVFSVMVSVMVGTFSSLAASATVTEVVTATGFNSRSTVLAAPLSTVIPCAA